MTFFFYRLTCDRLSCRQTVFLVFAAKYCFKTRDVLDLYTAAAGIVFFSSFLKASVCSHVYKKLHRLNISKLTEVLIGSLSLTYFITVGLPVIGAGNQTRLTLCDFYAKKTSS